jgi:hypothetical protein
MQKDALDGVIFRVLRELALLTPSALGSTELSPEQDDDQSEDADSAVFRDVDIDDHDIGISVPKTLSNNFILAKLFNLLPRANGCEGDSNNEDDTPGLMRLFRAGGGGQWHMDREAFERLNFSEDVDIRDLVLLIALMGQQPDPNTTNLLTVLILSKVLGGGGSGLGIETALLLSPIINANAQAATSGGTGVAAPMQNNLLPLLLALAIGRGEDREGARGGSRRGWGRESYQEAAPPEKKQPRQ